MTLALKSVIDIPETDVVSFLHDVISSQPKTQQDGDSMQVDVPMDTATSPVPDPDRSTRFERIVCQVARSPDALTEEYAN